MRSLLPSLTMILFLCAPTMSHAQGMGGGELLQRALQSRCNVPDSKLIKPGTRDAYNAQAKGFNDCLRVYVESENNTINQIRVQARSDLDHIADVYNSQIRDVERAINAAIAEAKIVNGQAAQSQVPAPAQKLASFPGLECQKPDDALLVTLKGHASPSIQNTDKFEQQRLGFESCVRTFIAQGKGEIGQFVINAQTDFHKVSQTANARIIQINTNVTQALDDARKAAGERDAAVYGIHSVWNSSASSIEGIPGYGRADLPELRPQQPGTESVTVTGARLPRSADMPTGAGEPNSISCRMPQQLPGSRLMGPEICKRNRDWAALYKEGKTISPDGTQIVSSEREMTFNPPACGTVGATCGAPVGH